MSKHMVSVIMASYNHAPYVAQAVNSVLAQKGVVFEFLIADDGSSDGTAEIIKSFRDPRITFFPNALNRGAGIVTNELLAKAKGDFIALLNSDDFWPNEDKLAYQVEILLARPEVGACFGRAKFIDKFGIEIEKETLPYGDVFDQENRTRGAWLRRFFDYGNCICHPTMLIRRVCYSELGMYSNRLRQLPDFDMWVRLVKFYDIFVSERDLVCFRILPGENASSQSPTNSVRTINEHLIIARNFFDNVSRVQLIEGFSDILHRKSIPSAAHLDIEKCLLYFHPNQGLGKVYSMIGIFVLNDLLLSDPHRLLLNYEYSIDDRWFHKKTGEIDVLRPKSLAAISSIGGRIDGILRRVMSRFRGVA